MGTKEAFLIGAAMMAFLIFLAVLRFCCNLLIDVIILDQFERARRSVQEVFRFLFPWWHVRTQPSSANLAVEIGSGGRRNPGASANTSPSMMTINQQHVSRILRASKVLTKNDMEKFKAKHHHHRHQQQHHTTKTTSYNNNHNNTNNDEESVSSTMMMMCSICIHDIHEGDNVYVGDCNHIFHQDCMIQWVQSKGKDCPNCRSEIIPSSSSVVIGDANEATRGGGRGAEIEGEENGSSPNV